MSLLSQTNFPKLWLLMQKTIGGTGDKRRLAVENYDGKASVLEIGCSIGNVSEEFLKFEGIDFTGIDIDTTAIAYARERFARFANFKFSTHSLQEVAESNTKYGYVLFAGILHHVPDDSALSLLKAAIQCLGENGTMVIYEPEAPRHTDNALVRNFARYLEQGQFLRKRESLEQLILRSGLKITGSADRMISPGIVRRPYVARFNKFICTPQNLAK